MPTKHASRRWTDSEKLKQIALYSERIGMPVDRYWFPTLDDENYDYDGIDRTPQLSSITIKPATSYLCDREVVEHQAPGEEPPRNPDEMKTNSGRKRARRTKQPVNGAYSGWSGARRHTQRDDRVDSDSTDDSDYRAEAEVGRRLYGQHNVVDNRIAPEVVHVRRHVQEACHRPAYAACLNRLSRGITHAPSDLEKIGQLQMITEGETETHEEALDDVLQGFIELDNKHRVGRLARDDEEADIGDVIYNTVELIRNLVIERDTCRRDLAASQASSSAPQLGTAPVQSASAPNVNSDFDYARTISGDDSGNSTHYKEFYERLLKLHADVYKEHHRQRSPHIFKKASKRLGEHFANLANTIRQLV